MSIYDCHSIESKILAMTPIFNVHVYSRLFIQSYQTKGAFNLISNNKHCNCKRKSFDSTISKQQSI